MINKVILIGNLGKDPEVRETGKGTKVANFSLATSATCKNNEGEKMTRTEWHNVVLWKGLAEIAEKFLHKGDQVYIEGRIETRSWEEGEVKKYRTEIIGSELRMLGGKDAKDPMAKREMLEDKSSQDDDLPF